MLNTLVGRCRLKNVSSLYMCFCVVIHLHICMTRMCKWAYRHVHAQVRVLRCMFVQPKHLRNLIGEELDKWGELGPYIPTTTHPDTDTRGDAHSLTRVAVKGHFEGVRPWVTMDELNQEVRVRICVRVGGNP